MPLPLGHAVIGLTFYDFYFAEKSDNFNNWKIILFISVLANLPDMDVVLGLLLMGNGSYFHQGFTHSFLFALLAGYAGLKFSEFWLSASRLDFDCCFLLVLSHVMADYCLNGSVVSWPWPLAVKPNFNYSDLGDIVKMILSPSFQEFYIILAGSCFIMLKRLSRGIAFSK